MTPTNVRTCSLFSGIGGFELALEQANISSEQLQSQSRKNRNEKKVSDGYCARSTSEERSDTSKFRVVWANEWDSYAASVYRKNFGEEVFCEGDIRKVDADKIPDFDLLTAGFPCQPFSIAGKRKGFRDVRGTLFHEIARITECKRPKMLLLENVRGLLSAQEGYCFFRILQILDELGYDVEWQTINGKNFLPQNRERVFIIGHLRGAGIREIFPLRQSSEEVDELQRFEVGAITARRGNAGADGDYVVEGQRETQTLNQIGNVDQRGHNSIWGRVYDTEGIATNLNAKGGGLGAKTGLYAMRYERTEKGKQARRLAQQKGKDDTPFGEKYRKLVPSKEQVTGCVTGVLNKDCIVGKDVANTVDKDCYLRTGKRPRDKNGKPQLLPIGERRIRRLTPTECEALQGFPKNWTKYGLSIDHKNTTLSDTQRYKMLGNAVMTPCVAYIAERILEVWK
jgi:DNA (cytosine-5)-methyltransferase 1